MARRSYATSAPPLWLWLCVALIVVVFDQLTKWMILAHYQLGDVMPVTSFFNVVRVHNAGAAFSFLAQAGGWQRWFFTGIAALAILVTLWLLARARAQRLFASALALILGGAIGNLIDRLWLGYVVDFLDFHAAGIHFPAFNIADSAISVGACFLILDECLRVKRAAH